MLHELRIYHCLPGRLPALNRRFESVTLKLWERHGIRQVGFWTVAVGPSNQALYYLLEWESLAEREKRWDAFAADPEWLGKRAESEKDGPIVARIENLILITEPEKPAGGDRDVMSFETLTLVPIDRRLVLPSLLTPQERDWLNAYHATVRARLSPLLEGAALAWLVQRTAPI